MLRRLQSDFALAYLESCPGRLFGAWQQSSCAFPRTNVIPAFPECDVIDLPMKQICGRAVIHAVTQHSITFGNVLRSERSLAAARVLWKLRVAREHRSAATPRQTALGSPTPRGKYVSGSRDRHPPSPRSRLQPSPDRRSRVQFQGEGDPRTSLGHENYTASAIIASTFYILQGSQKIKARVEACHDATVEALPDTGADISV